MARIMPEYVGPQWKEKYSPMTRVRFVYREQIIQVIDGENARKGEVTVITRDKDVPAHEVEKTVRKLADTRTD